MGWETRKGTNNTYYTRSRRVDGRVVREYLGSGPKAEKAARMSADDRKLRQQQRDLEHKQMRTMAKGEQLCEEFYDFVETVLLVWMDDAGYHYRRGEWRKRRVPKEAGGKPATSTSSDRPPNRCDANGSRSECRTGGRDPNQRAAPPPRRRPVPRRRMLDCRLGLVRGVGRNISVGRDKQREVPAMSCQPPQPFVAADTNVLPEPRSAGSGLRLQRHANRARSPPRTVER